MLCYRNKGGRGALGGIKSGPKEVKEGREVGENCQWFGQFHVNCCETLRDSISSFKTFIQNIIRIFNLWTFSGLISFDTRKLFYKHFKPIFWLQNNLCEFATQEYNLERLFCTQKLVLNIWFEDFWYTKINLTNSINNHLRLKIPTTSSTNF